MSLVMIFFMVNLLVEPAVSDNCIKLQGGNESPGKTFLNCSINLPCNNLKNSSIFSIDIYSFPYDLLATLDAKKTVHVQPLGREYKAETKGDLNNNGISYLASIFSSDQLKKKSYFECIVRLQDSKGVIRPFISSVQLAATLDVCSTKYPAKVAQTLFFQPNTLVFKLHEYFLSKLRSLSSADAIQYCALIGGYLAEIGDRDEFYAVGDFVLNNSRPIDESIFIGGTDAAVESVWRYQRTGALVEYFNWSGVEPNNLEDEDCLTLRRVNNVIIMNDLWCSGNKNSPMFLCEVETVSENH